MYETDEVLSNVEMAILAILSKPLQSDRRIVSRTRDGMEECIWEHKIRPCRQEKYYTFPMGADSDRLYAASLDMLLKIPDKSFGVIVPADNLIKEASFTKMKKLPKGYVSLGGTLDSLWQLDFYYTEISTLKSRNVQRLFGIKGISVVPVIPANTPSYIRKRDAIRDKKEVEGNFAACASLLEDAALPKFWNIEITDSVTIATYGDETDIKELLALRDAPLTPSGQRKRILHWVTKHKRRNGDTVIEIPKHLRGLTHYNIGGFDISITSPTKP